MVGAGDFADASTMTTAAQTPPAPEPPVSRRLTRSSSDRVIAGVAGGVGRYFSIDPVVVRIAFIVGAFFGGAGVIAYAAAWLLVPSDDGTGADLGPLGVGKRFAIFIGAILVTAVAAMAGFWATASGSQTTTAIIVIALGAVLVIGALTRSVRWLIIPALAMALGVSVAAAADLDISGGMG